MSDPFQSTLALFDPCGIDGATRAAPMHAADEPGGQGAAEDPVGARVPAPRGGAERSDDSGPGFRLRGDRLLARGWRARARDNLEAIRLARELEASGRAATLRGQVRLLHFTGFGATDLAQGAFPQPGAAGGFRAGWEAIGAELAALVPPAEYAALRRATQYAHYTPEPVVRAVWAAALHLGFRGGRVLEPGMGTGLFLALAPDAVADRCRFTGVEVCPVTARIARLLHPGARVRCEDYTRSRLGGGFDLAIGNPPFSRRIVRTPPGSDLPPLALHDHFVAASVARLRPGGIALFVTSTGTMDKPDPAARARIASTADLLGAVRLPEGSFRATAGTEVVVDVIVLQRRAEGLPAAGHAWTSVTPVPLAPGDSEEGAPDTAEVNAYFAAHPDMVLGRHAVRRGVYGLGPSYTCAGDAGAGLEDRLVAALLRRLPAGVFQYAGAAPDDGPEEDDPPIPVGTAAEGATVKEGSYLVGSDGALRQVVGGAPVAVPVRQGRGGEGVPRRDAEVVRALLPVRDAVREVLRAQAADGPWGAAQARLRVAYQGFVRRFGPVNRAEVVVSMDKATGEECEIHRRPNLAPFADDPDCWLVASVEEYDPDTNLARMGAVFRERVVAPPPEPVVAGPADALAVALAETGRVDLDRVCELLDLDEEQALAGLGALVFRDPRSGAWETADAYLSGPVRAKLAAARQAAAADPRYERNVEALLAAQPEDLRPSDISARLGAPWIPADAVEAFARELMGTEVRVLHSEAVAAWTVEGAARFAGTAAGTSEWGTPRRHAGALLHDALNGATPLVFDTVLEDGRERRVLNPEATEAAKEKLQRIKDAFADWAWADPDRADRLARIYNARFNDLVPRRIDGRHLALPGASAAVSLRPHQKSAVWRIVASGSSYIAHAVGSGKTMSLVAAIMEQRRLGLVSKAMVVVPGHCLAQWGREFLQLYPAARILVADEQNFAKGKRAQFLARAATAGWDAIVITHAAFRFIAVPAAFERGMIAEELGRLEAAAGAVDEAERTTRKRVELRKEGLEARLEALAARRDDMLTLEEIGVDQLVVDEAQQFRKLGFATNRANLKGVDPDGSARAWDLFVKARWVETKNPGRALVQASGTPVTNTLGEMFTLLRFQAEGMLRARGLHEFDAWAAAFGDTRTELELQPSGAYKPVERFAEFVNVPELVDLFRSVADVALKDDLHGHLRLPRIAGGRRRLLTAPASDAFRAHQAELAERVRRIEARRGKPKPGDDILLAVITDGRHAAIDLRLVRPDHPDEPGNKLNLMIRNVHRIWRETAGVRYPGPDGAPMPVPGAAQMVFSDLGTPAVEAQRGFSAYRWIRSELVRLGVPAPEVAFMQDFRKAADKQRLFADVNAGRVRVLIGSSETMGTGVNAQARLVALHHLDVPWLPSQIEQREGRIERQGNGNPEVQIWAYATLGSVDATLWQANERKARFIAAALSGDRSVRRLEDGDGGGGQAGQFALAKAIASGDGRLLEKVGLEAEVARLRRQRAAHFDDQLDVRRRAAEARREIAWAEGRVSAIREDLLRRRPTRGDAFRMEVGGRAHDERRTAGAALLSALRAVVAETTRGAAADRIVGGIGGFALVAGVRRCPTARGWLPRLAVLRGGGAEQPIDLEDGTTALGLVARLEHALGRMEEELEEAARRRAAAEARLPGYEARSGEPFPLRAELEGKLARLEALDRDLAAPEGMAPPAADAAA